MIEAERYRKIDEIFKAALELLPEERPSYISEACAGDEALIKEVEGLLASDEQDYEILNLPAFEMAAPLLASDQPELPAGECLGYYRILSLLGAGGMGQVYLAEDTRLNRKVALKLLPKSYTRDASRLRRFQQEARAASALNHPNILTIYDIWKIENRHIIVTEYIEGETLRQRMKREKLSVEEAFEISIQVASALWAAHQAGIIHRDIKPENIMLRSDGLLKVLDFGLAKLVGIKGIEAKAEGTANLEGLPALDSSVEESSKRLNTEAGLLMGTLPYMSPEQLQGESVDTRTDIYSLGVMLYEMVAGRLPFEGETNAELADSILQENPIPLSSDLAERSAQLGQIIEKALQKKREARYQTSGELLTDLKSLKKELESSLSTLPLVGWIKQHKAIAVVILIAAVAATFFALNRILRQRAVPFQNPKISKLTSYGKTRNAAISPDGKHVAYFRLEDQKVSLCLREVGTTEERQLVPPEVVRGFERIMFSPDSQTIYYMLAPANPGSLGLYQVPVGGGTPVKMPIRSNINFSPDRKRIAYYRNDLSTGVTSILVANADGTGERELARRQAPNYFSRSYISWSPDGKLLACIGTFASDGYSSVVTLDPETGKEKRITRQIWNSITEAIWLPDLSGLIIAAADKTSLNQQLWHISYPNGEARRITNDLNNYSAISMSADGNSLVATQDETQFRLWTVPVGFNGSTKEVGDKFSVDMNQAKPIATLSNARLGFCWTPDGRIIIPSVENGYMDLWIMDADGNNRKQLTNDPSIERDPWVSLDGRYIVFYSHREGSEHIWRVNLDGSNLKQLTNGSVERGPFCSPDSKWVYYNSWETGKITIWKVPIEGGEPEQVSDTVGSRPILSPDGSLIAFVSPSNGVSIMPSIGGQLTKTFKNLPGGALVQWTPDGSSLTFAAYSGGSDGIWLLPLDNGQPQQLIDFKTESVWYYRWSTDWKQLAFARGTETVNTVLLRNTQ